MKVPRLFGSGASKTWSGMGVRLVWIVAGIYLLLMALGAGLAAWTAAPSTCATCHEIAPLVASWRTSPHSQVSCPSCHEPVRSWARFPETFLWRAQRLQRDVAAHRANPNASTLPSSAAVPQRVPDQNCLQCHDLSRAVTLPTGLTMDHAKHVARNKSCVSCHWSTAHPVPDTEKPLALMERCFTCHGQPGSKGSAACTVCHPKDFTWRPQSHKPEYTWLAKHGKAAKANRQPCFMCHEQSFCSNCHGMPMPHPAGWAKGSPPAHAQFAKTNSQVCVQCHGPAPNLCSMCHHKGYDPKNGPWASNHVATVNARGPAFCMSCHDSVFCSKCHGDMTKTRAASSTPTP